ncbi:ABC transporter permease [Microvirga massiliensis]|uniref:ABC transporter permease n=1 Tax=Microvirga massiliensis TaxID=1033741 RepID=UPI0009E61440|nr:ABC transporter permease [Microvirga massiliensis]
MSTLAATVMATGATRRRGRQYALAGIGAAVLVIWLLVALLAPWLSPYDPTLPVMETRLLPPSLEHPLGTDPLGRDVLSRVLAGARMTLAASFGVILLGAIIGTIVGSIAAYAGRWVDEALMRLTDLVMCFPPIILAMAIAAALGVGVINTVIAMVVVWWPKFARLARSIVLVQSRQDYVDAARVSGLGPTRILLRHVFPNTLGPLIVLMTVDLGNAIITFASLSFLGLGVVPPAPEWGAMVAEGREYIEQWWIATFPGLAILTVVIAFNFVGDAVRDRLDPRSLSRW